jgi:hypothetical protein
MNWVIRVAIDLMIAVRFLTVFGIFLCHHIQTYIQLVLVALPARIKQFVHEDNHSPSSSAKVKNVQRSSLGYPLPQRTTAPRSRLKLSLGYSIYHPDTENYLLINLKNCDTTITERIQGNHWGIAHCKIKCRRLKIFMEYLQQIRPNQKL